MTGRPSTTPRGWTLKTGKPSKAHYTWTDRPMHTLCGHDAGPDMDARKLINVEAVEREMCRACFYLFWSGAAEIYRARKEAKL